VTNYLLRRFFIAILTALGVSFLVVVAIRLIPGSAVEIILSTGTIAGDDARAQLEHELGLDQSVVEQWADWLWALANGDLGESVINGLSVSGQLEEALPVTLELGVLTLLIAAVFGIPIGMISAVKQDTWLDYVLRSAAVLFLSVPGFLVGVLAIVFGSRWFGWTPPLFYTPFLDDPIANMEQFLVPAGIAGMATAAAMMRFTRTAVLDTIREDYVRTARAKGLAEHVVLYRHVLRNSLVPIISVLGFFLAIIIGGTVIFEQLFQLPGVGRYLFNSINKRDYPAIQTVVLLFGVVVVFANLLTDIAYTVVDPRIRLS
jgi:peptide/nickel transport system permease protein